MEAFTLDRRDIRERDQLISFYTRENGKVEAVAKGVKKITAKNTSALEQLALLEVEIIPGKDLFHATKVIVLESFSNIRIDLRKNIIAGILLKIVNNSFSSGYKDEELFKILYSTLKTLNSEKEVSNLFIESFIFKLWSRLGFKPNFEYCLNCKNSEAETFSFEISEGGIMCSKCSKKQNANRLSLRLISIFNKLQKENNLLMEKLTTDEDIKIKDLVKKFHEYHTEKPLPNWTKYLALV